MVEDASLAVAYKTSLQSPEGKEKETQAVSHDKTTDYTTTEGETVKGEWSW